ncbi:MAG: hypothetical protein BWY87_00923 [Deltaproteobacteria bacterium ADurb.Bin510]|nr:MAG: hypothetical protein BWY87_00923 [Deltaproteobacteria bacterium ADurb.Bin510]
MGREVVVLDSDESNTSLYWMLGLEGQPLSLMDLAGGREGLDARMKKRHAQGPDEPAIPLWDIPSLSSRDIPAAYISHADGVRLVTSGKINHAMEGCACAMGSIACEFVKNFSLAEGEIMLVDTEAGVEHFGRGVEAGADLVISVVEPSLESLNLAATVMEMTVASGARYAGAIINKCASPNQVDYMQAKLSEAGVPVLGALALSEEIQMACLEGQALSAQPCADQIVLGLLAKHETGTVRAVCA